MEYQRINVFASYCLEYYTPDECSTMGV